MWNALKKKVSKTSGSYHVSANQTGSNTGNFNHLHGSPGGGQDYHHLHVQLSDAEESDGSVGSGGGGGGSVASGSRAKVVLRRYKKIPSYSERLSDVADEDSQAAAMATSVSGIASSSSRRENPYAEMTATKALLMISVNEADAGESRTISGNDSSQQRINCMTSKSTTNTATDTSATDGNALLIDNARHVVKTAERCTVRSTSRIGEAGRNDVTDMSNNNAGLDAEDLVGAVGGVDNGDLSGVERKSKRAIGCDSIMAKYDSDDKDDNANSAAVTTAAFFSRRRGEDGELKVENASLTARISPPRMKRREKTSNRAATATSGSLLSSSSARLTTRPLESTSQVCDSKNDTTQPSHSPIRQTQLPPGVGKECTDTPELVSVFLTPASALLPKNSTDELVATCDKPSNIVCRKSEIVSEDEDDESGSSGGAGEYCRLAPEARVVVERSISEKSSDELSPAVMASGAALRLSAVSHDDDESGYATLNDVAVAGSSSDFPEDGTDHARVRSESRTTGSDLDFCWQRSLRTSTATAASLAETGSGSRDDDQNVFADCVRDSEFNQHDSSSLANHCAVWNDETISDNGKSNVRNETTVECEMVDRAREPDVEESTKTEFATANCDEPGASGTVTLTTTQTKLESDTFDGERRHGTKDAFPSRSRGSGGNRRLQTSSSDESFSIGTTTTTLSGGFRRTDVEEADTTTAESMATTTTTTTSGDDSDAAPWHHPDVSSSNGRRHRRYCRQFDDDEEESSEDYCDIPDDHVSTSTRTATPSPPPPPPPPRNNVGGSGSRRAAPDLPVSPSSIVTDGGTVASSESDDKRAATHQMTMAAGLSKSAVTSPIRGQEAVASNAMASIAAGCISPCSDVTSSASVTTAAADDDGLVLSIDLTDDMLTVAEPTHMSWHEVMQSAQILGIPLHRMPTAAAAAASTATPPALMSASWSQPTASFRSEFTVGRRSSLSSSSVTSSDRSFVASPLTSPSHPVDASQAAGGGGNSSKSSTPRHRPGTAVAQATTAVVDDSPSLKRGASRNKKVKASGGGGGAATGGGSGSSPFRTKLQNLFSRKSSDDNRSPSKSSTTSRKETDARTTMAMSSGCNSFVNDGSDRKFVIMRRHRDGRQPQSFHLHQQRQQQTRSDARTQSAVFECRSSPKVQPSAVETGHRVQSWTPLHYPITNAGAASLRTAGNGSGIGGGTGSIVGMYRGSMLSVLSSSFSSGSLGSVFSHASSSHSGSNTSSSAAPTAPGSAYPSSVVLGRQMSIPSSVGWKGSGNHARK
jgi:hypothetical protein